MTKMIDEQLARLRTHRNNIARYRRLSNTRLTDHERAYVERRMAEEQSGFDTLTASTFPVAWEVPEPPPTLRAAPRPNF